MWCVAVCYQVLQQPSKPKMSRRKEVGLRNEEIWFIFYVYYFTLLVTNLIHNNQAQAYHISVGLIHILAYYSFMYV